MLKCFAVFCCVGRDCVIKNYTRFVLLSQVSRLHCRTDRSIAALPRDTQKSLFLFRIKQVVRSQTWWSFLRTLNFFFPSANEFSAHSESTKVDLETRGKNETALTSYRYKSLLKKKENDNKHEEGAVLAHKQKAAEDWIHFTYQTSTM